MKGFCIAIEGELELTARTLEVAEACAKAIAMRLPGVPVEILDPRGATVPGRRYLGRLVQRVEVQTYTRADERGEAAAARRAAGEEGDDE